MIATPAAIAAFVVVNCCSTPSSDTVPAAGWFTPNKTLSSVDLPAPFSPMRPCTSPQRTSSDTWSSASTPGKRTVMPSKCRYGSLDASAAAGEGACTGTEASPMEGAVCVDVIEKNLGSDQAV